MAVILGFLTFHSSKFSSLGYLAVFLLVGLEALAIPVPGEVALISASLYSAQSHHLNIVLIILSSLAGLTIGSSAGYLIGNKGGLLLLKKYGRYVRITEDRVKIGFYIFDKYGVYLIFFGRFFALFRTLEALLAGISEMKFPKFIFAVITGGLLWTALYSLGSYYFYSTLKAVLSGLTYATIPVVFALAVIVFLGLKKGEKSLVRKANQKYPGSIYD